MNIKKHFLTTYELIISALFIALITVGAFIKIPLGSIPITLQSMFVLLAGQILTPKCAALTILIYIAMGLFGLPVFSGGGGLSYILTPMFGYIVGFFFAAIIVSAISHKGNSKICKLILANFFGLIFIYVCGIGYYILLNLFYFNKVIDIAALLLMGVVVFIPKDVVFCVITAIIAKRISPIISRKIT